ncbi:Lecithin [Carpediemonas membranifera]|uniref:Lecithin n=1 Tax=Carpediemonas membranifera TaxID=201153 RepID=A0A8J6E769_9EUKA|nr:Lecithin [Carpediemonas membranifera]|eukprot:KAG9390370.1 Lecithin [Carpediemonas membranifera]
MKRSTLFCAWALFALIATSFADESSFSAFTDQEATDIVSSIISNTDGVKHPILFVPGLFGSQLEWKLDPTKTACNKTTKGTYEQCWIHVSDLLPGQDTCWVQNNVLGLSADGITTPRDGVETRVAFWPLVKSVEYLTDTRVVKNVAYYGHNLFKLLRAAGYEDNKTYLAHPYDFRASPLEYYQPGGVLDKFATLVEHLYATNGNTPVDIVAHSMGCLVTTLSLGQQTQAWKDKYIHHAYLAGPPFGGAPKLAGAVINAPHEFPLVPPVYASEATFIPALSTWCGGIWLAPDTGLLTKDTHLITHAGREYKLSDMGLFLNQAAAAQPLIYQCFKQTRGLFTERCKHDCAPGVDTTILYGISFQTQSSFKLTKGDFGDPLLDIQAEVESYVVGDQTVPVDSATTLPKRWAASGNHGHSVNFVAVENVKHQDLVRSKEGAEKLYESIFG